MDQTGGHHGAPLRTSKEAIRFMTWFIDAMNVIGSTPDGWWRDREGAIRRFVGAVEAWAEEDVTVVLDSGPDDLLGTSGLVTVIRAARRGRDAADDEIVARVQAGDRVTTSDSGLAARVRARGAEVERAGAFLRRLGSAR
jgi:hypothetical protein